MATSLPQALAALARSTPEVPPGVRPVSGETLAALAREHRLSLLDMERATLAAGLVPARYLRNMRTFDAGAQRRFLDSRVALAGLGGLGGHLLELLARAGVGRIEAADGDRFEESNLNRQLLCETQTLGWSKAEAARERAARVNPAVQFAARGEFLDLAGFRDLARGADLALDALGGVAPRLDLRRAAALEGVPLLTAAVAGTAGYVALVRPGDPAPTDFFPARPSEVPAEEALGTPAPTVALAASLAAAQALAFLADPFRETTGGPLAGRMLLFDLADASFETVALKAR